LSTKKTHYPEIPRKNLGPGWWLANRHYTVYMIRELTSFFVTAFSLIYIYQVYRLASNPGTYSQYLDTVPSPAMISFSIVALGFALFHSVTWFYLIGKIQPIKIGRKKTSPLLALGINTVFLVIISFAVLQLFIVGK